MLQSLKNIWEIPDLRRRVLFTLGILAIYRLGNHIPTPGINAEALIDFFKQNQGNWFGLVDMFSGGNLSKVTIFALGIMPYISASIILQLLTVVWATSRSSPRRASSVGARSPSTPATARSFSP